MATGSQYGEDSIIDYFFKSKGISSGFFVDVGAADGVEHSNTYNLGINGWSGILIEPDEVAFNNLLKLYGNNKSIKLINEAVYSTSEKRPFYKEPGQASTLSEQFRDKVIGLYGIKYDTKMITCNPLYSILDRLSSPKNIDFLSIDAEGIDMIVLDTMDWDRYTVSLLCVEHSMPKEDLRHYMESKNYKFYYETCGNTFYIR